MSLSRMSLIVLALGLSSCAITPEQELARMERRAEAAAAILSSAGDADSLAAAAILTWDKDQARAVALLERAAALAPNRSDLAWLQLHACLESETCAAQPMGSRLAALTPENGAPALDALTLAQKASDSAAETAALKTLAQSVRVDIYWTTLISRLTPPVAATRKMSLPEALAAVTGQVAAVAVPLYTAFANSCKGDRLNDEEVVANCRNAARALMRGDSLITEMMGVAVAKRVWPRESAEWKAASETRRVYAYRSRLWHEHASDEEQDDVTVRKYLLLLTTYPREQDVFKAQIVALGLNPDPPADWVDPNQK